MIPILCYFLVLNFASHVSGHIAAWHPSMWGFNVTDAGNFPKDPLMDRTFEGWWFHNHLDHPPHPTDFLNFPAGGKVTVETTCDKGATSYWASNPGGKLGDVENGNDPCPGSPPSEYHTTNKTDVKGCAFAIAYIPPSEVMTIKPEDFTIFTVNQTCVWYRHTDFQVPAKMPACPPGGCTCAWFWIHAADSGSEQIYMNGYQCNITGATSTVPLAQPQVARRCGKETEPDRIGTKPQSATNCTYGAKQPLYWDNLQGNNMFEDPHHPPFYNDLYNYRDGAQDDIFVDSHLSSMTWAGAPTGVLKPVAGQFGAGATPTPASAMTTSSSSHSSAITPSPKPKATEMHSDHPDASSAMTDPPKSKPTNSHSHPKGCQCRKCKSKNDKSQGHNASVTKSVHATPKSSPCSTYSSSSNGETEEIRTISPEEANSILSMATAASNATHTVMSPSASPYVYSKRLDYKERFARRAGSLRHGRRRPLTSRLAN